MEGNHEDMDDEKLHTLPESNSVKPTSGHAYAARFGEIALEVVKNFLKNNKAINQFVDNIVYG